MYVLIWRHNSAWLYALSTVSVPLNLKLSQLNSGYTEIHFNSDTQILVFVPADPTPVQETSVLCMYLYSFSVEKAVLPSIRVYSVASVSYQYPAILTYTCWGSIQEGDLAHGQGTAWACTMLQNPDAIGQKTIHQSWSIRGNIARNIRLPSNPIELFDIIYPRPGMYSVEVLCTLYASCGLL